MNKNNLNQIFEHYIDRFEYINNEDNEEYYKWQVCNQFPMLMKKALSSENEQFPKALYEAKKCTFNIIDSYTQPFSGLVDISKYDPDGVRELLLNLYADDGGDLKVQMEIIADFFKHSNELIDLHYPESYRYRQDSHSVSALLFLNDPDHHYMYKAVQSQRFADCVEFYDDWGTGDNIRIDTYYRMCDELVEEIKNCDPLIKTDSSRFDGRLKLTGGELHPDTEKHILAFDIIYCCSVYDLFDGISYTKRNMKEKQLYLAEKAEAERLKQSFDQAKANMEKLEKAWELFIDMLPVGEKIKHPKYGEGTVKYIDNEYIYVKFADKEAQISLSVGLANNLITTDKPGFKEKVAEYRDVLKNYKSIQERMDYSARALKPYEEYLN